MISCGQTDAASAQLQLHLKLQPQHPILPPVPVPDPAPIRVQVFGNFCCCLRGTYSEEIQDIYFKFLTLPCPTPGPASATPMHFCRAAEMLSVAGEADREGEGGGAKATRDSH